MRNSFVSFVDACYAEGAEVANLNEARFNVALPKRQWEVDCTITIPDVVPMMATFGEEPMVRKAVFIPCQVEFPDGMVVYDKLFLSTLTKVVQGTEDGKRFYDYAKGTANQLLRDCGSWQHFFNAIAKKPLRVAAVRTHNVCNNLSGCTTPKSVYDIDLA